MVVNRNFGIGIYSLLGEAINRWVKPFVMFCKCSCYAGYSSTREKSNAQAIWYWLQCITSHSSPGFLCFQIKGFLFVHIGFPNTVFLYHDLLNCSNLIISPIILSAIFVFKFDSEEYLWFPICFFILVWWLSFQLWTSQLELSLVEWLNNVPV